MRGRGEIVQFIYDTDSAAFVRELPGMDTYDSSGPQVDFDGGEKYEYHADGQLTKKSDANGNAWTYTYGTIGVYADALTKVSDPNGDEYTLTYDAVTEPVKI